MLQLKSYYGIYGQTSWWLPTKSSFDRSFNQSPQRARKKKKRKRPSDTNKRRRHPNEIRNPIPIPLLPTTV